MRIRSACGADAHGPPPSRRNGERDRRLLCRRRARKGRGECRESLATLLGSTHARADRRAREPWRRRIVAARQGGRCADLEVAADVAARLACCTLSLISAFTVVNTPASETMPARLYEVITETSMPHLEENLRYAITRENRCLAGEDLATAFPVLKSVSLADCKLRHEGRHGDAVAYR